MAGQAPPTSFAPRIDTATELNVADPGSTGCPVHTIVAKWFRAGEHSLDAEHPTEVVQDNEVVGDIVAKDGKTKRLQALRPFLRIFRLVWQAIKDMHVAIKTVASGANAANSLTKMSPGPLATVRGLEGVMGWSPELQEYVDAAERRHSKKRSRDVDGEDEADEMVGAAFSARTDWPEQHWLRRASPAARGVMGRYGFQAETHRLWDNPYARLPIPVSSRQPKNHRGIGLPLNALAAQLLTLSGEPGTLADYEAAHTLLQLPCPERDAKRWEAVLQQHTQLNANPQFADSMDVLLGGETLESDAAQDAIMVWASASQLDLRQRQQAHDMARLAVLERQAAAQQWARDNPAEQEAAEWWQQRRAEEERCTFTTHHFSKSSGDVLECNRGSGDTATQSEGDGDGGTPRRP